MIGLVCLLLGPVDRRGQSRRIVLAIAGVVAIQGLYLGAFNMARDHVVGLILMDILVLGPLVFGLYALSGHSESWRQKPWLRRIGRVVSVGAQGASDRTRGA